MSAFRFPEAAPGGPGEPQTAAGAAPVKNVFTVDVEDWYHLKIDAMETWKSHERRVHIGTEILLEMMARRGVRGTFFVLAYVAETTPDVVKRIAAAGHEIATHGYNHQLVYRQTAKGFEEDLKRSLGLLGDLTGTPIVGYRASSFSVSPRTPWFWDALARNGISWDSSTFPVFNAFYGGLKVPAHPHMRPEHGIVEIPIAPVRLGGFGVPFSGGVYFRLHNGHFIRWAGNRLNRSGLPAIYYVHPWEFDAGQPRMALPPHWWFFRYYRIEVMTRVTEQVLAAGRFETMGELAARVRGGTTS